MPCDKTNEKKGKKDDNSCKNSNIRGLCMQNSCKNSYIRGLCMQLSQIANMVKYSRNLIHSFSMLIQR